MRGLVFVRNILLGTARMGSVLSEVLVDPTGHDKNASISHIFCLYKTCSLIEMSDDVSQACELPGTVFQHWDNLTRL